MEKKQLKYASILFGGIALLIGVLIIAAVMMVGISAYNDIVKARNLVDEAAGQVQSVLQRRLDLIPNLVETVKGYAKHEQTTLEAVVQARTSALEMLQKSSSPGPVSMKQLSSAQDKLSKAIFALVEQYPDLKANANFLTLQDQLEGTENRIAVERIRYNDAVRAYNTKISVFPGSLVALLRKFREREYFEASSEAQDATKVQF